MLTAILALLAQIVDVLLLNETNLFQADVSAIGFIVVALAGFANAVGQSGTLFVNRLKPPQFATGFGFAMMLYAVRYAFWVVVLWTLLNLIYTPTLSFIDFAALIGLAHAPHLLAYLIFVPCLGTGIGVMLTIWLLATVSLSLTQVIDISLLVAVGLTLASWTAVQVLRRSLAYPLVRFSKRLQGQILELKRFKLQVDSYDLIDHIHRDVLFMPSKLPRS